MRWKKGNHKLTVVSLAIIVLGALICSLPYSFWVTGALLIALGAFMVLLRFIGSETVRGIMILLVCTDLIVLEVLMGLISVQAQRDPAAQECDAAIVLGAQVNGTVPSMALRTRLDAALDFMDENAQAVIFLSGGKGSGEDISEAQAMYNYLQAKGADMTRVYMENASTSTLENLRNTQALAAELGIELNDLCIITSEFHMSRSMYIASRLDIDAISYSAKTRPWLFKMNYYLREIPAFLKAWIQTAVE